MVLTSTNQNILENKLYKYSSRLMLFSFYFYVLEIKFIHTKILLFKVIFQSIKKWTWENARILISDNV